MIATCSPYSMCSRLHMSARQIYVKDKGMLIFTAYYFSKVAQLLIQELFTIDIPRFKYKIQPRTGLRKFTHGSD